MGSQVKIIDITKIDDYKKYLNTCLTGPPSKACKRRTQYTKNAIAKGFHKKLLFFDGQVVGQIEYSPAEASYYPIIGENLIVMNCIWVLRRSKGHDFGKKLLTAMMDSEKGAHGFATIALENHWSPWFKKEQIEKLGFKSIDSIDLTHKTKHKDRVFRIHLMWMPKSKAAQPPAWNKQELLEGITTCTAHPLYHPQTYEQRQILRKHDE